MCSRMCVLRFVWSALIVGWGAGTRLVNVGAFGGLRVRDAKKKVVGGNKINWMQEEQDLDKMETKRNLFLQRQYYF